MRKPASILVVEDEGVVAMNLKMILMGKGYNVLPIAISANTALTLAAQYHPQVVLMDIRIKGDKDGIDTARLISEHYHIPIIYTTAHFDPATVERAAETEHVAYLVKPYSESELFEAIDKALNGGVG
jgi:DNA-binding NarL/FixJ family response regulator